MPIIRVYLVDGRFKTVNYDNDVSIQSLTEMVIKKLSLEQPIVTFSEGGIYEYIDIDPDIVLRSVPSSTFISKIQKQWEENFLTSRAKLVFKDKKSSFLPISGFKTPTLETARNPSPFPKGLANSDRAQDRNRRRSKNIGLMINSGELDKELDEDDEQTDLKTDLVQQQTKNYEHVCLMLVNAILMARESRTGTKINHIRDIETDFRSGVIYQYILEELVGVDIVSIKLNPKTKQESLDNLGLILKFLRACGCVIEDCIPEDLYYGKKETILRFISCIINFFQTASPNDTKKRREVLLEVLKTQNQITPKNTLTYHLFCVERGEQSDLFGIQSSSIRTRKTFVGGNSQKPNSSLLKQATLAKKKAPLIPLFYVYSTHKDEALAIPIGTIKTFDQIREEACKKLELDSSSNLYYLNSNNIIDSSLTPLELGIYAAEIKQISAEKGLLQHSSSFASFTTPTNNTLTIDLSLLSNDFVPKHVQRYKTLIDDEDM